MSHVTLHLTARGGIRHISRGGGHCCAFTSLVGEGRGSQGRMPRWRCTLVSSDALLLGSSEALYNLTQKLFL